ncbi:MAG: ggt [Brevibacillus sp.]|nr:ggt [Brevibacillus sp.]
MAHFDAMEYPYASRRVTTFARNGMVATSQPLAAQAGLDILKKGGNAIDAAIATAACLTVVEPTSNGIGGDAFALVWVKDELYGLNSSGPAPQSISIDTMRKTAIRFPLRSRITGMRPTRSSPNCAPDQNLRIGLKRSFQVEKYRKPVTSGNLQAMQLPCVKSQRPTERASTVESWRRRSMRSPASAAAF